MYCPVCDKEVNQQFDFCCSTCKEAFSGFEELRTDGLVTIELFKYLEENGINP
jgi:predicted nucleic acid-binding Zn ribbon protein